MLMSRSRISSHRSQPELGQLTLTSVIVNETDAALVSVVE